MNIDITSLQFAIETREPSYIAGAFDWAATPQEHEFWAIVYKADTIPNYALQILIKIRDEYYANMPLAESYPSLPLASVAITNQILQLSVIRDKILAEDCKFLELYSAWEDEGDENLAGDAPKNPGADAVVDLLEDALRNLEDAQELAKRWRR